MIIIITGKSASGKTTLMNLLKYVFDQAGFVKTVTTCVQKPNNSSEAKIVSQEEFQKLIDNKELASWRKTSLKNETLADYCGVTFRSADEAIRDNKIAIYLATPAEIPKWHRYFGEKTIFIHLLSPIKNELRQRMLNQSDLNEVEINNRIELETKWDLEVADLKKSGVSIYLIPSGTLEEVFFKAIEFVLNFKIQTYLSFISA